MRGTSKKRKARTAAQEKHLRRVVSLGCLVCGEEPQVHHCVGETAEIKGVGNIGHWWIVPLCPYDHGLLGAGADNLEILVFRLEFFDRVASIPPAAPQKFVEKVLFEMVADRLNDTYQEGVPDDVHRAIQEWSR